MEFGMVVCHPNALKADAERFETVTSIGYAFVVFLNRK
jgi:hypothetical protein